jgi:hypothetical protein
MRRRFGTNAGVVIGGCVGVGGGGGRGWIAGTVRISAGGCFRIRAAGFCCGGLSFVYGELTDLFISFF